MFTIRVKKNALLEKIRENRAEHRAIFEKAVEGYKDFVIANLDRRIERLRQGKAIEETLYFAVPQDHTDDYDRVIGMLEMSLDEELELEESLYRMYVDNNWAWAQNFATSNASYTALAGSSYQKYVQ